MAKVVSAAAGAVLTYCIAGIDEFPFHISLPLMAVCMTWLCMRAYKTGWFT